jgi:hypothetical protein
MMEWDVPWIAWNPDLRETEDIDTFLAGFVDDVNGLCNTTLEV